MSLSTGFSYHHWRSSHLNRGFLRYMDLLTVLTVGLVFGLKHATEVDHVVAVSTIVSQQRNIWRSTFVGAMWGAGHTASLLITDRKSTRLNSSHGYISYAVFCLKKKKKKTNK